MISVKKAAFWLPFLFAVISILSPPTSAASSTQPDEEMRLILLDTINNAKSFEDRFDAEVWLLDMSTRMSRYIKDPEERMKILRIAHKEARRVNLRPELVLSVMHVESLFDQFALSSAGAQGIMQVMPFWKKEIGTPNDNLMDISTNIRYGCTILKAYLKRERGNERKALARYNGSVGKNWYPERVFNAWKKYWFVQS
ncbi:hypothetical protein A9Q99_09190 [Gammaproteobacteria bacterium 45_16_T64]|nr:hypothetical protein A9Q99_09190 [Gammaproteobacteria bacterium 45_16_T64]